LCEALQKEIGKQGRAPTLFVEINTGAEAQKAGVLPQDADAFLKTCRETYGLTIGGLMCIPPQGDAPAPHFALTAKIAARNGLKLLSMGMSADYETAIEFGATHVRVGSAIFGGRHLRAAPVMPGLVPGHVLKSRRHEDVDGRGKPGHDECFARQRMTKNLAVRPHPEERSVGPRLEGWGRPHASRRNAARCSSA
jgi:hypothetical protein